MLSKTFGSAVYGVDAVTITVEVNVLSGNHYFIVGLPDNAVKESLSRLGTLAPAEIRKKERDLLARVAKYFSPAKAVSN